MLSITFELTAFAQDTPLNQSVRPVSGSWGFVPQPVTIGGELFDNYGRFSNGYFQQTTVTFDVRHWAGFRGYLGVSDNSYTPQLQYIAIELDGQVVKEFNVKKGDKPIKVEIAFNGKKTLTFKPSDGSGGIVFGNPVLLRRSPTVGSNQYEEILLGSMSRVTSGRWLFVSKPASAAGRTFETYNLIGSINGSFVTLDIRGWEGFSARVGMNDTTTKFFGMRADSLTIELDGQPFKQYPVNFGQEPFQVEIPLAGHKTLTLKTMKSGSGIMIGAPKLFRGKGSSIESASAGKLDKDADITGHLSSTPGSDEYQEMPLRSVANQVAGHMSFVINPGSVGGKVIKTYGYMHLGMASFVIKGWDGLKAEAGISDTAERYKGSGILSIEIDGQPYKQYTFKVGDRPVEINVPLTGHETITFKSNISRLLIGDPTLYKGKQSYANSPKSTSVDNSRTTKGKTITNAEIVKMVKAQLNDDIIIGVIESNTPSFDLTPDALINLKNQGVSQRVINAMLKAQQSRSTSSVDRAGDEDSESDISSSSGAELPTGFGGFIKTSEGFLQLTKESISGTRKERGLVGRIVEGLKDAKTFNLYRGESSGVQVPDSRLNIYISGADSYSSSFLLLKLKQNQGKREVEYSRINVLGKGSEGFSDKDIHRISTKKLNDNLVIVTPQVPLEPGQYILIIEEADSRGTGYSFGVRSQR